MRFGADVERLPMDVLRAAQAEIDHPRGNRAAGQFVDQDEAPKRAAVAIRLEHDRLIGGDFGDADRVQIERLGGEMLHAVDRQRIFGRLDRRRYGPRAELQPVSSTRDQRLVGHPHDGRVKLIGGLGRVGGGGNHIAARTVDFVGQAQGDRLARNGLVQVA